MSGAGAERKPERSVTKNRLSGNGAVSGRRKNRRSGSGARSGRSLSGNGAGSGVKSAAHGPLKSHNHPHIDKSSSYFPKSTNHCVTLYSH